MKYRIKSFNYMTKQLKYIYYLLVLIGFISACSQTQKYIPYPEKQIVQKLSQKRIVMLGDFAHEWPLSYNSLTSTLSTWLTMLEKGECNENQLTLFLEEDEQVMNLIKRYLKTGDLNPFLDFILPSTSFERLEFYSDLRRIITRIDNINSISPSSKRIIFDIQGAESISIFDPKYLDASEEKLKLLYVFERDSLSAMNIIAYLKVHPERKGLIFYGNGHLIKNLVVKDIGGSTPMSMNKSGYIAYYLKKEYGEDQVFTISSLARGFFKINFDDFDKNNFLVFSKDVPWKDSQKADKNLLPDNFDAFYIRQESIIPSHPLAKIFSRRTITASIKRLEFMEPHRIGPFGKRFYSQALQTLQLFSDTSFSKVEEWKSWFAIHQFDGLNRLQLEDYGKHLANDCFPKRSTHMCLQSFEDFGFSPGFGDPRKMSRQEWDSAFCKTWPEVIFFNCIGIYWIGDIDERVKAKSYLVEFSGKDFQEADQYLKWWRNKLFNVNY